MSDDQTTTKGEPLPEVVPLVRHVPSRISFDWKRFRPESVGAVTDLPPYLVLGRVDTASFMHNHDVWQATRRVPEGGDGWLRVELKAITGRYRLEQSWNGAMAA